MTHTFPVLLLSIFIIRTDKVKGPGWSIPPSNSPNCAEAQFYEYSLRKGFMHDDGTEYPLLRVVAPNTLCTAAAHSIKPLPKFSLSFESPLSAASQKCHQTEQPHFLLPHPHCPNSLRSWILSNLRSIRTVRIYPVEILSRIIVSLC